MMNIPTDFFVDGKEIKSVTQIKTEVNVCDVNIVTVTFIADVTTTPPTETANARYDITTMHKQKDEE